MSIIYKGNWPHDKKWAAPLLDDDPVLIEADTGPSWGPRDMVLHMAMDRAEAETILEQLLTAACKMILRSINMGLALPGKPIAGWPLPALAKVDLQVSVKLHYHKNPSRCDKRG